MQLLFTALLFILGLLLIVKGGDWFVDAASWMAEITGIPKFIIGATIVSLATTLPELLVSLLAALDGKVEMAIGNAVGSVIANTGLILGISLVAMASRVAKRQFNLKAILLVAACVGLWVVCRKGGLDTVGIILMGAIFLLYIVDNIVKTKEIVSDDITDTVKRRTAKKSELPLQLFHFIAGTIGIVVGARLLVDNGSELARVLGVPENIIALTFVAVGTSLPELVTTITAISKKQASLSVGNILGANIIDLTMILPACALASDGFLPVGPQTIGLDLPVCLLFTLVALVPPLLTERFYKWQGFLLLGLYAAYLGIIIF